MPELKPLPCPACGSEKLTVLEEMFHGLSNMVVCSCGLRGPKMLTPEAAITAWNSLPRALTWTKEPPEVLPGFYFLKMASGTISMVYLSEADLMHNDWHGSIGQWVANAGPITPPREMPGVEG